MRCLRTDINILPIPDIYPIYYEGIETYVYEPVPQ